MNDHRLEDSIFGSPDARTARARRVQSRRELHHPPKKKGRGPLKWLVLLVAIAVVAGGGYAVWPSVKSSLAGLPGFGPSQEDVDFAGPGSGQVVIEVKQGDTGEQIASSLKDAGVTKTRQAYLDAAKTDPAASGRIQVGKYQMRKAMTGMDAFQLLINPANRLVNGVTVREGLWASEIYPVLSKATGVPVKDYLAAAKNTKALGLPAEAKGNVEGWLFPATYDFEKGMPATQQLKTMVGKAVEVMTKVQPDRAKWESTMILGSIVQAEAGPSHDAPKIARVFLNRMSTKGETYGLLQSDATVSYGVKRRSVTTTDAERADPNKWNTYKWPGLPIGPISNPGEQAIAAAAKPADGPWFFFVAVNPLTGETKFATTYNEHLKYVAEFQAFCKANPGTC